MNSIAANSCLSLDQRSPENLSLALVHDGCQDVMVLITILSEVGLRTTTVVHPLDRLGEIAADPPGAIVVAIDSARSKRLAAIRLLHRDVPDVPIVVIADEATSTAVRDALNAGAQAFVFQADAARALAPAVCSVVAGLVCAPSSARRGIAKPSFTTREKDVLALLVNGMTNRQIAAHLWLEESTVKTHVKSILSKLGVCSRQDAAAIVLDPMEGLQAIALPPASSPQDARFNRGLVAIAGSP